MSSADDIDRREDLINAVNIASDLMELLKQIPNIDQEAIPNYVMVDLLNIAGSLDNIIDKEGLANEPTTVGSEDQEDNEGDKDDEAPGIDKMKKPIELDRYEAE